MQIMKYVIISIESRNLNPEGEVLYIKANPVKDAGPSFRHLEKMFGKKYYHYSHTESDETTHFVLPFSESTLNRFLTIANLQKLLKNTNPFGHLILVIIVNQVLESKKQGKYLMFINIGICQNQYIISYLYLI